MAGKILVVGLGLFLCYFGFKGQKERTSKLQSGDFKEIMAKVTDFDERIEHDTDEDGRTTSSRVYYPIYEYTVDGVSYYYTGKVGSSFKKGRGKTSKLLYNTKDPNDCISPKDKSNILIIILGIFLAIGGWFI